LYLAVVTVFGKTQCFNEAERSSYETEQFIESYFTTVDDLTEDLVDEYSSEVGRVHRNVLTCEGVTLELTRAGRLEVTLPEAGCTGPYGYDLKGSFVVEWEGTRWQEGFISYTVLNDFYIDGVQVKGARIVENITTAQDTTLVYQVTVNDGEAIWPDGTTATRNVNRKHFWYLDNNGLYLWITGRTNGVNKNDVEYETLIDEDQPLYLESNCVVSGNYIPSSGIKTLSTERNDFIIDYGNGSCDNKVIISVGGRSAELTIN
jgi:hypothetical protein